jgi:hypothetical protein
VTSIGFLALMWEFQPFFITLIDKESALPVMRAFL